MSPLIQLLVTIGVLQNAPRAGETLKSLAMALGAYLGGGDGVLRLIAAAAALELKYGHTADVSGEGVVRHKLTFRLEAFHAD